MLLSMTGFANKSYDFSWGTVSLEISSVNHKYQDFTVKLPSELSSLENRILALMRNSIGRGKVRFSAEITWNPGANVPVIDENGLLKFLYRIQALANSHALKFSDDITNYLMLPGILDLSNNIATTEARENPEIWDNMAKEVIESFIEMKKQEGEMLAIEIESDIDSLEKLLEAMNESWKDLQSQAIDSLKSRIENVLLRYNLEIDEARIASEVAILSDKWDISEEIARMESHIEKFKMVTKLNEPSGKKLDFLIQEMNREVNTMGTKIADADFRWLVVEAKSCIERIREQIQNIE